MNPTPTPTPAPLSPEDQALLEQYQSLSQEIDLLRQQESLALQQPASAPSPRPAPTPMPYDNVPVSVPPVANDPLTVGGALGNFAGGIKDAAVGAWDLAKGYSEHAAANPTMSAASFGLYPIADMIVEAYKENPENALYNTGKSAAFTAGALLPGVGPVAAPIMSKGYDMLMGGLGLRPMESPPETVAGFERELGASIFPIAATKAVGKTMNAGRSLWRDTLNHPDMAQLEYASAVRPGAVARVHDIMNRRTNTERSVWRTVEQGEETWLNEYPALMKGVDANVIKNRYADPVQWGAQWQKYRDNLSGRLEEVAKNKLDTLSQIDAQLVNPPPRPNGVGLKGRVEVGDLNLDAVRARINERNMTAVQHGQAEQLQELLGGFESDFTHNTGLLGPNGKPIMLPKTMTLGEAQTHLRNFYDKLEEARVFDDAFKAKQVENPSVQQQNAALLDALGPVTDALRERIRAAALEGADVIGNPTLRAQAGQLAKWDEIYHDLNPYKAAANRFQVDTEGSINSATAGRSSGLSLNMNVGAGMGAGNVISKGLGIPQEQAMMLGRKLKGSQSAQDLQSALMREPRALQQLQQAYDYRRGGKAPVIRKSYDRMKWSDPEANIMGTASWMMSAPDMLEERAQALPVVGRDTLSLGTKLPGLLPLFLPQGDPLLGLPNVAAQFQGQIQSAMAAGNVKQLSLVIGQLKRQFPTLPIKAGITGLPSEITLDDGKSYLFDPQDVAEWKAMVQRADISPHEKSLRTAAIDENNVAFPINVPMAPQPPQKDAQFSNPDNTRQWRYGYRAPQTLGGSTASRNLRGG